MLNKWEFTLASSYGRYACRLPTVSFVSDILTHDTAGILIYDTVEYGCESVFFLPWGSENGGQTNKQIVKFESVRATPSCFACFTNASIELEWNQPDCSLHNEVVYVMRITTDVMRITTDCRISEVVLCAPKGSVYNADGREWTTGVCMDTTYPVWVWWCLRTSFHEEGV